MNRASRIRLAKQLLHYARMVLDAEQFKHNIVFNRGHLLSPIELSA